MSSSPRESLLTVSEVAKLLGFHRLTVYEKVANGEIPAIRIGRRIRFDRQKLAEWLEGQQTGTAA